MTTETKAETLDGKFPPIKKRYIGKVIEIEDFENCSKAIFEDGEFFCFSRIKVGDFTHLKKEMGKREKLSIKLSVFPPCVPIGNCITAVENAG